MPDVFRLPDLGEGLTESEIVTWRVAEGDAVALDQVLAEVETAKATVELPSPQAGVVERLYVPEGTTVAVGSPLVAFRVDAPTGSPDDAVAPQPNLVGYGASAEAGDGPVRRPRRFAVSTATTATRAPGARPAAVLAAPPVRHLAATRGVRLDQVRGTGPNGLVSRADVERAAAGTGTGVAAEPEAERIPVRGVRRRTAAAMTASAAVPQATVFTTVDVTATLELLAAGRDAAGRAPTVLAAIARAVCLAVPANPSVNARWDEEAGEILRFRAVHLGIAVATPRGLLVPVLRDAQGSAVPALASRLREIAEDARADRTSPQAMTGGTFTISNVGVFGVDSGTPMLHDGQSAILAVGAVARRPWEWQGEVALRSTVVLALTFDHRVLDGEEASRFLVDVGRVLTDPATAFLR